LLLLRRLQSKPSREMPFLLFEASCQVRLLDRLFEQLATELQSVSVICLAAQSVHRQPSLEQLASDNSTLFEQVTRSEGKNRLASLNEISITDRNGLDGTSIGMLDTLAATDHLYDARRHHGAV